MMNFRGLVTCVSQVYSILLILLYGPTTIEVALIGFALFDYLMQVNVLSRIFLIFKLPSVKQQTTKRFSLFILFFL